MKLRLFVNARFCVGLARFLNDVVCCLSNHRFVSALGCFYTVVVFVRYSSFGCFFNVVGNRSLRVVLYSFWVGFVRHWTRSLSKLLC